APSPAAAALPPLNRFPRMMQEWLVGQVREAEARGNARRAALKTKADAEAYVVSVRERIRQCFGPEPERTPLNAKVTGTVERDGYRIEKVIFESRPEFLVTGNLYLPTGRTGKMPGVIGVCGHSANGKAAEAYQGFAQGLARLGYICFIIDPPGQGERFQYLTPGSMKSRFGPGVTEHIQSGNQQTLVGDFLGAWFAWDSLRALDYLLSRPEVDPRHVGVTGNSGGGTQTTWLCGLEPRFTMAAPACFVTTFRRNAENELPADTEQCPPGILAADLDHSDFLAAMAPKPVVILAQEKDFFDVRGSMEAYERLKHLYTLLGKPENIRLHIGSDYHGYSQENREAMYRFFNSVTHVSDATKEPALTIEKDETLWCTPNGQVSELKSRTIASFTSEKAQALAKTRKPLQGTALTEAVKAILKLAPEAFETKPPDFRILRIISSRKYPTKGWCTYAVETEPGIQAMVTRLWDAALMSRPPKGIKQAILYVSHLSADRELREEPLTAELLQSNPQAAFYACDVRGTGDSQPDICGADQFLKPYGSNYFLAAHGLMLDRPYLGQKVHDLLRVLTWLADQGHEEVHLAGKGWGAIQAAFAALLSPLVRQVTLKHTLTSFENIATTEDYRWPLAALPHGVLKVLDLPEVYAALAPRQLQLLEPWSALDGMNVL
ncbi:MAG TPA: acetylxylan esterase, partial [Verrucomicrobium sp.]|nr:acetylxylan esterase [Verrucomicrobium sp.]